MKPTDVTNPTPATAPHEPSPKPGKAETFRLSFWISQFFILAATVLGVYLASTQGFKQALAFGDIQSARSNYYLRKSLQGELSDNIPLVRAYMTKLEKGGVAARKAGFTLDTFVWESMKNSSATLETPPELLRESRLFYRSINDIQEKVINNTYDAAQAIKLLQEIVDRMEKEVLPKFETNTTEIKDWLGQRGVEV